MVASQTRTKRTRNQNSGNSERHAGARNGSDRHGSPNELSALPEKPTQASATPESESPEDRQAPALAPALKVGDRVRITKFPGSLQWVGMRGIIKDFEGKGAKTQVLLSLDNDEGGLWVLQKWVELVQEETLEFWEGDRVRGQTVGGQIVEGIVLGVGHVYLKLDSSPRAVLKATAEMIEPGAEAVDCNELTAGAIELLEHVQNPTSTTFAEAYEAECQEIVEAEKAIAYVDQQALESFAKLISCDLLTKDKVRGTFAWEGREWVATGGRGSGSAIRYEAVWAIAAIPAEQWGKPTYSYGNLPRDGRGGTITYKGQLISYRKRRLVLTGKEVEFRLQESAIAPALCPLPSALDSLIAEINTLYGNLEEAEEVASTAAQSAFTFALEIGHKLIKAKVECGHGNWEQTRQQIKSPRSGKALPSSTATLYQRMAKRQAELEQAEICTLRAAAEFLKSDRQLPSSKSKSATVAEIPPPPPPPPPPPSSPSTSSNTQHPTPNTPSSLPPKLPPDFAAQSDEEVGLVHPIPNTQHLASCHNCKYRVLTGSGDRYWCEQGEFDDTLLLKYDWFVENEGCKSFAELSPDLKPTYRVPANVLRLEDVEAGKELHGLVLSEERFFKLAALARSLNGSMAAALFQLIDQLPEVDS